MKPALVAILSAALCFSAPLAHAQWRPGDSFTADEARNQRDNGNVPLRSILSKLKRKYGGYHIDANLYNRGGKQVYIVEWMTEKGKRMRFTVDAKSGRVLSSN